MSGRWGVGDRKEKERKKERERIRAKQGGANEKQEDIQSDRAPA